MELAASLVNSLAWPTAAIGLSALLRRDIGSALTGQVKRWKAGPAGLEVEYWERTVAEARQQLPAGAEQRAIDTLAGGLAGELGPVAQAAPSVALMEAFARVELVLRQMTKGLEAPESLERMGARQLAVVARRSGRIGDQTLNAINGLSVMRNLAAHGRAGDLDAERALEFVHLADGVLYALSNEPRSGRSD
jgi:hypothetical protein